MKEARYRIVVMPLEGESVIVTSSFGMTIEICPLFSRMCKSAGVLTLRIARFMSNSFTHKTALISSATVPRLVVRIIFSGRR
jgi:hypothetical protein